LLILALAALSSLGGGFFWGCGLIGDL
jgi:hypothetical protein